MQYKSCIHLLIYLCSLTLVFLIFWGYRLKTQLCTSLYYLQSTIYTTIAMAPKIQPTNVMSNILATDQLLIDSLQEVINYNLEELAALEDTEVDPKDQVAKRQHEDSVKLLRAKWQESKREMRTLLKEAAEHYKNYEPKLKGPELSSLSKSGEITYPAKRIPRKVPTIPKMNIMAAFFIDIGYVEIIKKL